MPPIPRRPQPVTIIGGDVWTHRIVYAGNPDLTGHTYEAKLKPSSGTDTLADPLVNTAALGDGELILSYTKAQTATLAGQTGHATLVVTDTGMGQTIMVADVRVEADP